MKETKDFKEIVLGVLEKQEISKDMSAEIRVVRWEINGKPTEAKLEKRMFSNYNGQRRMGKATGFTHEDFMTLMQNQDKIGEMFLK